jgi:hypothetical protein
VSERELDVLRVLASDLDAPDIGREPARKPLAAGDVAHALLDRSITPSITRFDEAASPDHLLPCD